jgi:hypothetical protein
MKVADVMVNGLDNTTVHRCQSSNLYYNGRVDILVNGFRLSCISCIHQISGAHPTHLKSEYHAFLSQ